MRLSHGPELSLLLIAEAFPDGVQNPEGILRLDTAQDQQSKHLPGPPPPLPHQFKHLSSDDFGYEKIGARLNQSREEASQFSGSPPKLTGRRIYAQAIKEQREIIAKKQQFPWLPQPLKPSELYAQAIEERREIIARKQQLPGSPPKAMKGHEEEKREEVLARLDKGEIWEPFFDS